MISHDLSENLYLLYLSEGPLYGIFVCVCFRKNSDPGISSWDWNLSGQHSTYHALLPQAWTVYDGMPLQACVAAFLKFSFHQELYLLFLQLSTETLML
jgi:hypothetical protein